MAAPVWYKGWQEFQKRGGDEKEPELECSHAECYHGAYTSMNHTPWLSTRSSKLRSVSSTTFAVLAVAPTAMKRASKTAGSVIRGTILRHPMHYCSRPALHWCTSAQRSASLSDSEDAPLEEQPAGTGPYVKHPAISVDVINSHCLLSRRAAERIDAVLVPHQQTNNRNGMLMQSSKSDELPHSLWRSLSRSMSLPKLFPAF